MKYYKYSVVISTYNRKKKLLEALEAILSLDYPKSMYEVIVSDDGSEDGTEDVVKPLIKRNKNLSYIKNKHRGVVPAVNTGMVKAKNEILVFIADDNIVRPDFLSECNKAFNKHPRVKVISMIQKPRGDMSEKNIFGKYEWFMTTYFLKSGGMGPPFAFKREVWEAIGGLDESFKYSEDVNFCARVIGKGYKILRTQITVEHNHNYNLDEFIRQMKHRGRSGRESNGRLYMAVKLIASPLLVFKYWYQFYEYGYPFEFDMLFMHCAYNLLSSIYGVFLDLS